MEVDLGVRACSDERLRRRQVCAAVLGLLYAFSKFLGVFPVKIRVVLCCSLFNLQPFLFAKKELKAQGFPSTPWSRITTLVFVYLFACIVGNYSSLSRPDCRIPRRGFQVDAPIIAFHLSRPQPVEPMQHSHLFKY
jgi:hypothetical protein